MLDPVFYRSEVNCAFLRHKLDLDRFKKAESMWEELFRLFGNQQSKDFFREDYGEIVRSLSLKWKLIRILTF